MKRVVVGIGNPGRTDDAVGLVVARRLKDHFDGVITIHNFLPEDLLNLRGYDEVVIIDGVISIAEGDVKRFSVNDLPGTPSSTHFIEVDEMLKLGRALYADFPTRISVLGIGIKNTDFAEGLSPTLKEKIDKICQEVLNLLS